MAEYAAQFNSDTWATTRQIRTIIGYVHAAVAAGDLLELEADRDPPGGGTNPGVNAWKVCASLKGSGVALRAAAAGTLVEIQVAGICDVVKADATAAIAVGDFLVPDAADGRVSKATTTANPQTTTHVVGRALSALASGQGTIAVELFNPHGY